MQAWLQQFLDTLPHAAITLLTLLINAFPPLPAKSTFPVLAHIISCDDVTPATATLAATLVLVLGLVLRTMPFYLLGRWPDERQCMRFLVLDRHEHWLALPPKDIDRSSQRFGRYVTVRWWY